MIRKRAEKKEKRFQVTLKERETDASSTYRELRSIESGLTLIGPEAKGCVVRYGNDNYAAVRVVEYGSFHLSEYRIQEESFCTANLQLTFIWVVSCPALSKPNV